MINTLSFENNIETQIEFILSLKHNYSEEELTNILLRFHQYLISHPEVLVKDISFDHLKDKLNNLYKSKRQYIYENNYLSCKRVCSFCGRDAGDTLDHFYPKVKFPEFSIFLNNLVPCCSNCNTLKDDYIVGEDIYLVHPFYVSLEKKILYKLHLKNVVLINGNYSPELELFIDDADMTIEELFVAYGTLSIMKIKDKVIRRCIDCIRNHLKNPKDVQNLLSLYGNVNGIAKHFSSSSKKRLETLTVLDYLALDMLGNVKNLKLFANSK